MLDTTHLHLSTKLAWKRLKNGPSESFSMRSYNISYNIYFKENKARIKAVDGWYKGSQRKKKNHFWCTKEQRPFQKMLYLLSILKVPVLLTFQLNPSTKKQVCKDFEAKDSKCELAVT